MQLEPMFFLSVLGGIVVAYFCGSIPVALIVGKLVRGVDVREHGSGNPGTTNAIRVLGTVPGIVVLAFDVGKGALSCFLMYLALTMLMPSIDGVELDLPMLLALFAAIGGHMFSPFMRFKGGKGIACAAGGFLVVLPLAALVVVVLFAIVVLITRIVSIGSMAAATALPFAVWIFYGSSIVDMVFAIICTLVVLYAHRKNIVRIVHHEEPRISFHRKGQQ